MCFLKTMHTEAINHDPAVTFFQTGAQLAGRPRLREPSVYMNLYVLFSFDFQDYGTSLLSGPYAESNIAQVFRDALQSSARDSVRLADFKGRG